MVNGGAQHAAPVRGWRNKVDRSDVVYMDELYMFAEAGR